MIDDTTWFDDDIQMIYENTTTLITWQIDHNFTARPDFALPYYPPIFTFYWFTSRTLNLLTSTDELPNVLIRCRDMLAHTLRNNMTDIIINAAHTKDDLIYFEEFLGNGDDRIYSTAMAVNALFYTWTSYCLIRLLMPKTLSTRLVSGSQSMPSAQNIGH